MRHIDPMGSREAAACLGLSRTTVNRRALRGSLPFIAKLSGPQGAYLFDRAFIEELAKESAS